MRAKLLRRLAPDTGGSGDGADKVVSAVTEAVTDALDSGGDTPQSKNDPEEKLDPKAELFVRRITDSVRTAMAELLNPKKPDNDDDNDDNDEAPDKPKRKTSKREPPKPKPRRSILDRLI